MDIRILGGEGEIGGNKVLLTHKKTKILLDFGMSFSRSGQYFSEYLQPRKCSSLIDFFEFGLLPDVPGIYREDYLRHMERNPEEREVDALFLSHAHMDHTGYIHFLRKDIPIYCTEATKVILQCMQETGRGSFSEFLTCCEAFTFYKTQTGSLGRVNMGNKKFVKEREYIIMKPDTPVEVNSITVEMVPVDHSIPGACAFIVYTDEGNIVYSGDFRFHGLNGEKSSEFVEKAREARPQSFICEGTRIHETKKTSEEKVEQKIKKLIPGKGHVFVEHPKRDIDRAKTIYDSAEHNGREFVVDLKSAYLIEKLGEMSPLNIKDLKILTPKKGWGLLGREDMLKNMIDENRGVWGLTASADMLKYLIERDYLTWEKEDLFCNNAITCEELKNNPENYVISTSFWEISQLVDIQPKNAIWIQSKCEPFSDEMELDEKRKDAWLAHFGIDKDIAHASGHASGPEIREVIESIHPKKVIPVHTEHPELF
ncbi:MAG: MBL fold metallo-hydrolase [Theionarchaea archaeon]|nr:MBL fold metallo-hydrolase [Theionarchaea archaeon]